MKEQKPYTAKEVLFSKGYLTAQFFTLVIFFLGIKWTLLGLYWIPADINPVLYVCVIVFWLHYNFLWIRNAIYLPATMLAVNYVYGDLKTNYGFLKRFYIALCKLNRARKAEVRMRRETKFIRMAAFSFTKIATLANKNKQDSQEISKAVFIHSKKKVISVFRTVLPYFSPLFAAILLLTPLIVFLSDYNYTYLIEHITGRPPFTAFWIHLIILPFKLIWVFAVLCALISNIISPIITSPLSKIFALYVKQNNTDLNLTKKHHLPLEGFLTLFMILTAFIFYISIFLNILL